MSRRTMRYCYALTHDQLARLPELSAHPACGFEIRLDSFSEPPRAQALRAATPRPLLATYRSRPHLGMADPADREMGWAWRMACLEAGFEMVDVELDEVDVAGKIREIQRRGGKAVLSHHDLGTGEGLDEAMALAQATRADIIKIIATGRHCGDFARQRRFYRASERPLIHFSMGAEYAATRVLSLVLGAPFTFITAEPDRAVAPGQLSLTQLDNLFQVTSVDLDRLKLFAVIGAPVGHSRSPAFHNPLLKTRDKNALFVALPAADEADLARLLEVWPELCGLAVTKPMKQVAHGKAQTFLDNGSEGLGAINTLIRFENGFQGANTDMLAMIDILRGEGPGAVVRVLGYGGLGKAVVAACRALGLVVEVANRTPGRVRGVRELPWERRHEPGPSVFVQATSAGMAPAVDVAPLEHIPAGVTHLIETIYNPTETKLLRMARQAGVKITNGHVLFEGQARIQNHFFLEALAQCKENSL